MFGSRSEPQHRRALATIALLGLAPACSLVFGPTLDDVGCSADGAAGPPACPVGAVCIDGLCRRSDAAGGAGKAAGGRGGAAGVPVDAGGGGGVDPSAGAPAMAGCGCDDGEVCTTDGECLRPCCSSAQCAAEQRCELPVDGGPSRCVPGAVGALAGGDACNYDGECRSGWCDEATGVCTDACCRDADCDRPGERCLVAPGATPPRRCGLPRSTAVAGSAERCREDADCEAGSCRDGRCAAPCCSARDCGAWQGLTTPVCRYELDGDPVAAGAYCGGATLLGAGPLGAECQGDGDCASLVCRPVPDGTTTRLACTAACCEDDDCGSSGSCVLVDESGVQLLRCAPG